MLQICQNQRVPDITVQKFRRCQAPWGKIFTFSFHFYYLLKKSEIYYKAWFLNRNFDFLSEKSIYLLILLFPLKKSEIYTQYSIIRNGDQRPPVEFLKISKILDSHRSFFITSDRFLAVS